MAAQFAKKTLFSKIITGLTAISFILTSVPVKSFASADKLRPSLAKTGNISQITEEMKVSGDNERIIVEDNMIFGPPVKALFNKNKQTGILNLEEFTVAGQEKSGAVRTLGDFDTLFSDQKAIQQKDKQIVAYWMMRNVLAKFEGKGGGSLEKIAELIKQKKIRADITLILSSPKIGKELMKTTGHYHPALDDPNRQDPKAPGIKDSFTEVYVVLDGEAIYYLQKIDKDGNVVDAVQIHAKKGDIVPIPSTYGHITINPSPDKVLKMMNWVSDEFTSTYPAIRDMKGGAYYFLEEDGKVIPVLNPEYAKQGKKVAKLRQGNVDKELAAEIGLPSGKPVYNVLATDRAGDLEKLVAFLNKPESAANPKFDKILGRVPVSTTPAPTSVPTIVPVQIPFVLPQILVLDNEITLFSGANTGAHNVNHTMLNKADGGLYNHSEPRARLELAMSNMLKSILRDAHPVYWAQKPKELEAIKGVKDALQKNFLDSIKITANLEVSKLPEEEKNQVLVYLDKVIKLVPKLDNYQNIEIELLARSLVNKIVNAQLKELIARSKESGYPIQQTVVCVGETKAQYLLDRTFKEEKADKVFDKYLSENTKKIIAQDLTEMLDGISAEDAQRIGLRAAYEPRWAINTGLTPSLSEIQDAHRFIKDTILAQGLVSEVDYGGSLNAKNAAGILALADVDGGLIGGAAKTPEAISLVLGEAITQGQKKGKILNIGMNWKAEDQETGLKPLSEFEKMFKDTDLSKVRVVISTPQVPVVKARMAKLAVASSSTQTPVKLALLNKFFAYLSAVSSTEEIGLGYSKGIIASSEKTEQLEKLFGEKTKKGDTYSIIGKNNAYFALAKENNIDQTLTVLSTVDLSNPVGLEAYYSSLLEYVSLVTTKSQKGLELINIAGDELKLKSFLTNKSALAKARPNSSNVVEDNFVSGSLAGIKRWMGTGLLRDEFFQFEYKSDLAQKGVRPTLLTFKRSKNKLTRGWSAIVQPKYTHLIFGFGTIGSEVGKKSREMGFNVVAVNRSPNEKAGLAQSLGVPLYLLSADDKKAFEKAKIGAEGILEDLLKNGEVDLITDATDGETEDPETKEEITVAAYNKKYIYSKYPKIKVMYEGAEDPKIADRFFDSGTLNVLKIPYSKAMEGVNSLFFPSCNTTGQGFILDRLAFNSKDLVVRVTTGRRANDPGQKGKLSPDGTAVETGYHHAEDYLEGRQGYSEIINAFRKGAKNKPSLTTDASNTHLTKFHLTEMWISGFDKNTGKKLTAESVKKFLSEEPRIALVDFKKDKFDATLLIDILFNKLSVIHPFTPIVQVLDLPDSGDVKVTKVVPQESIVIPNNMNGIHALTGLYEREASTRLVNDVMQLVEISQAIESTLPLKSARVKTKESKEVEIPAIPGIVTYTNEQLEDFKSPDSKPVYATLNTDVGDIENEQVSDKQDKKLLEGYDYLERLSNNNALYILGHNGRPAGKYVEKLSLFAIARWYAFQRAKIYGQGIEEYVGKKDGSGRFIEASYWIIKNYRGKGDVKVWFLPDTDNASINKYAQIVKDLKPGDWAIPENRRMDLREQAGDPAGENPNADPKLREAAIKDMLYRGGEELLVGPIGFNFGTADVHRYDSRITDAGKFLLLASGQNTADFIGRVNKIRTLISQAHEKGAVAFVVSGLKKDKIELLLEAVNNVLRKGDKVVVVGAINAYPLAAEGKSTGKMEIKKDALETWKEVVEAAKAKGIDLYYSKALKVVKDLTTAKKEDIQVIQDGNIPEGYVIGDVADQGLTEIFNIFEDENVKLVLQSGPVGPFDLNDVLAEGSNKFQQKLAELSLKKKVVSLGSDTQKANKKAGVEGKFPDQYTDGGSFLDALTCPTGKDCPAITALKESAKIYAGVIAKDIEKEAERIETAAGEVATKN